MLLATTTTGSESTAVVQEGGEWYPVEGATDLSALFSDPQWRRRADDAVRTADPVDLIDSRFANPLPRAGKILCCGLNYRDHIIETGRELPLYPTLFAKFADTLVGPSEDIVVSGSTQVDWEAELAVVIGRELRRVDPDEAAGAILGYTVANDVSMRDWQSRTLQWLQGKAWDSSTPVGPVVVTADAIDPVAGLSISCDVNGSRVQGGNTSELVFDAQHLVSYISQFTTLRSGDIVLTGTPGGVGMGMTPPKMLADGDVLTTTIEGIGSLRNVVRFG